MKIIGLYESLKWYYAMQKSKTMLGENDLYERLYKSKRWLYIKCKTGESLNTPEESKVKRVIL